MVPKDRSAQALEWVQNQPTIGRDIIGLEQLTSGQSNLTYLAMSADEVACVVRTQPSTHSTDHTHAVAHDLEREVRVIRALRKTRVPVPFILALGRLADSCPIYAMSYVTGTALGLTGHETDHTWPKRARGALLSASAVLRDLHALDPSTIGLSDHGPSGHYLKRQISRWNRQVSGSELASRLELRSLGELLLQRLPRQRQTTVVHGDFHLGNLLTDETGTIRAVIDWELSTLGDPVADFVTFLAYLDSGLWSWGLSSAALSQDDDKLVRAMLNEYDPKNSFDGDALAYYLAWAHWKIACIGVGICERAVGLEKAEDEELKATSQRAQRHAQTAQLLLSRPPGASALFSRDKTVTPHVTP